MDPLVLEKLPSLKGSYAMRHTIKIDGLLTLIPLLKPFTVRFLENSFSSEYSATLQQMYQGDVEARFLKVN